MKPFEARYTPDQREALASAYNDAAIRPVSRIVSMAAAGTLKLDAQTLEPFKPSTDAVYKYAAAQRRRRAGTRSNADIPPRDAVEALRRRLVSMVDAELRVMEVRKAGTRDPERIRQLARAAREIAALPLPDDARPAAPGQKPRMPAQGGITDGGLGATILQAHGRTRASRRPEPAQEPLHTYGPTDAESSARSNAEPEQAEDPGSYARSAVARIAAIGADHLER